MPIFFKGNADKLGQNLVFKKISEFCSPTAMSNLSARKVLVSPIPIGRKQPQKQIGIQHLRPHPNINLLPTQVVTINIQAVCHITTIIYHKRNHERSS